MSTQPPAQPTATDQAIAAFEAAEAQLNNDEAALQTAIANAAPLDADVTSAQATVTSSTAAYKEAVNALIAALQADLTS